MKANGKTVTATAAPVGNPTAENAVPPNVTFTNRLTVKVVMSAPETEETKRLKQAAQRATEDAHRNAFQRSLPIYVSRNGKVLELYEADVKMK